MHTIVHNYEKCLVQNRTSIGHKIEQNTGEFSKHLALISKVVVVERRN